MEGADAGTDWREIKRQVVRFKDEHREIESLTERERKTTANKQEDKTDNDTSELVVKLAAASYSVIFHVRYDVWLPRHP